MKSTHQTLLFVPETSTTSLGSAYQWPDNSPFHRNPRPDIVSPAIVQIVYILNDMRAVVSEAGIRARDK